MKTQKSASQNDHYDVCIEGAGICDLVVENLDHTEATDYTLMFKTGCFSPSRFAYLEWPSADSSDLQVHTCEIVSDRVDRTGWRSVEAEMKNPKISITLKFNTNKISFIGLYAQTNGTPALVVGHP